MKVVCLVVNAVGNSVVFVAMQTTKMTSRNIHKSWAS